MENSVQEIIERSERLQLQCAILHQHCEDLARRNKALYQRSQDLYQSMFEIIQQMKQDWSKY